MGAVDAPAGRIEFGVLGPLEVRRAGSPVDVVGARQRTLLALLLLDANRAVPVEVLIDELYGGDPPEAAGNAIQAAVSRLRRALAGATGESGDRLLARQGRGYVLRVDASALDLLAFERLAGDARAAHVAGDAARAAALFDEALALWRGPPLVDLPQTRATAAAARRLEELRLGVEMDALDAALALGQAAEAVSRLEALVSTHPFQERLRGQLMLALYRSGRQAEALAVYRETRRVLQEELGLEPSRELQRLERAILEQDETLEPPALPTAPEEPPVCPFKGLAPFELADAPFFCGRDGAVDDVLALLATGSFVGIVGASGSGKSSILRAGVAGALAGGRLPGSESWSLVLLRPGERPSAALRRALGGAVEDALAAVPAGRRIVVAVDQLEEAFATCADEADRSSFLEALTALAADAARRAAVLVCLRADFYGRCAEHPEFGRLLSRRHLLLGQMRADELAEAVARPAARAGLRADGDLVEALVGDVAGRAGGLPLLGATLLELWRRREGRRLSLARYRELGGVSGAVARLAESVYGGLGPDERQAARALFLRLTLDEGDAVVRRRLPLAELSAGRPVVDALVEGRLLTVDEGAVEVAHEAVLREWPRLQRWLDEDREGRRLHARLVAAAREWDEGGRDAADVYRGARLAAASEWAAAHPEELAPLERTFLDVGRRAADARVRRLRAGVAALAVLVAALAVAGAVAFVSRTHARAAATAALAGKLGAEAVVEPRIDRALLLAREAVALDASPDTEGTLLATLLRSPAAIATFTGPLVSRPQRLSVAPDGRSIAVSDNNADVRVYDVRTHRLRATLRNLGFGAPVTYSADGSLLVAPGWRSGRPTGEVRDTRTLGLRRLLPFDHRFLTRPTGASPPFALDAGGRHAFYAYSLISADGAPGAAYVDAWDTRTGKLLGTAPAGVDGSSDLRVVDGGRALLLVGKDGAALIDPHTLRRLRRIPLRVPPSASAVVDGSGRELAYGNANGTVSFVDLRTGRVRVGGGGHAAPVAAVGFSPDGRLLVSGGEDGSVIVWDTGSALPVQRLEGQAGRVLGIGFGPGDRTLFTCGLDGAIFEWDLGQARRFGSRFGPPRPVQPPLGPDAALGPPPLALSPDGTRFAVRRGTGTVAFADASDGRTTHTWSPPIGPEVTGLAWSRRGLVVTGDEGRVELWRVSPVPVLIRRLRGLRRVTRLPETVTALAVSPGGAQVAAGDVNHTPPAMPWRYGSVAVWDTATGRLRWQLRGRRGMVTALAFSPDGRTLAAAYENGQVLLYAAQDGRALRALRPDGGGGGTYQTLAFSPGGLLATGTWAGIVELWNPSTGAEVGRPTLVAAAPVASISFSPTGTVFATTGGSDGLAKLWRTGTLQQFGAALPGDRGTWGTARYTPDGRALVVVDEDEAGWVWPASLASWEQHACRVAGRRLTREEWRRFVGSRPYRPTCGA